MAVTVTRDEARNDFDAVHDCALKEPVRVTDGKETAYVVSAESYHALKQARRALPVEELTDAEAALIESADVPSERLILSRAPFSSSAKT
jgi:hypothetical protein